MNFFSTTGPDYVLWRPIRFLTGFRYPILGKKNEKLINGTLLKSNESNGRNKTNKIKKTKKALTDQVKEYLLKYTYNYLFSLKVLKVEK